MILQCWIDRVNFKGLERIQKDRKGHKGTRIGSERNQKDICVLHVRRTYLMEKYHLCQLQMAYH